MTHITEPQRRKVLALADRLDIDPNEVSIERLGRSLGELSTGEAATLIDWLKAMEPQRMPPSGRFHYEQPYRIVDERDPGITWSPQGWVYPRD